MIEVAGNHNVLRCSAETVQYESRGYRIVVNAGLAGCGYAKLKLEFLKVIAATDLPPEKKIDLLATLEKYAAVDMALAFSSYDAVLID